jgi:tetratricopeptide (TPR) repeat protein
MPDLLQAHNNLAVAYLQADEPDKAIEASLNLLRRDEGFAPAHFNLALAYRQLDDRDKAREHFDKAKALGYPIDSETEAEFAQG